MAQRKSFLVRLPAELHDELNQWAADELRSLNAQIEYLLREAARRRGRPVPRINDESSATNRDHHATSD